VGEDNGVEVDNGGDNADQAHNRDKLHSSDGSRRPVVGHFGIKQPDPALLDEEGRMIDSMIAINHPGALRHPSSSRRGIALPTGAHSAINLQ
jgi:hypothetical protein